LVIGYQWQRTNKQKTKQKKKDVKKGKKKKERERKNCGIIFFWKGVCERIIKRDFLCHFFF